MLNLHFLLLVPKFGSNMWNHTLSVFKTFRHLVNYFWTLRNRRGVKNNWNWVISSEYCEKNSSDFHRILFWWLGEKIHLTGRHDIIFSTRYEMGIVGVSSSNSQDLRAECDQILQPELVLSQFICRILANFLAILVDIIKILRTLIFITKIPLHLIQRKTYLFNLFCPFVK